MPTGNPLNHVTTIIEISETYELAISTPRVFINRHKNDLLARGVIRKSGATWLISADWAKQQWGKTSDRI